jgi:hypothetical protein
VCFVPLVVRGSVDYLTRARGRHGLSCGTMFLGHFALAFAAKRIVPSVPLPGLFLAVQAADVEWPVLVALGIEQVRIAPGDTAFTPLEFVSYPYSHSLLCLTLTALGVAVPMPKGTSRKTILVTGLLVVSHWLLDWISHRPDMPLVPDGGRYGLGLWNSIPATLAVELTLFAAGVTVYLASTRARTAAGRWGLLGLVAFLLVAYFGAAFGPPPPNVPALVGTALFGTLLVIVWSWWVDRGRESRVGP